MKPPSDSCLTDSVPALNNNNQHRSVAASVLEGLDPFTKQDAISRAKRTNLDRGGRQRRIGAHVGMMVRQLLYWEQKGQLPDYWIHKTAREWLTADASFTKRMLRTAERVAVEEGLMEVEEGRRPGDRQQTKFYRLNLWEVTRVVVASELENIESLLKHEGRKSWRDQLNKRRRELERARDDLNLLGERDYSRVEAIKRGVTGSGPGGNKLYPLQETTQSISYVDTSSSLRSSKVSTPGASAPKKQSSRDLTAKTISRTRELGFEASRTQSDAWGAGWKRVLSSDNPLSSEEASRVLAMIVSAAAGAHSQNGAGFCMSVEDAVKRVRNPRASSHVGKGKQLLGRTGGFEFDD